MGRGYAHHMLIVDKTLRCTIRKIQNCNFCETTARLRRALSKYDQDISVKSQPYNDWISGPDCPAQSNQTPGPGYLIQVPWNIMILFGRFLIRFLLIYDHYWRLQHILLSMIARVQQEGGWGLLAAEGTWSSPLCSIITGKLQNNL